MDDKNNQYKHLNLQDRYDIKEGLNCNYSFSRIADMLRRDRTTISKEVFKRRVGNSLRNSPTNDRTKFNVPNNIYALIVLLTSDVLSVAKPIVVLYTLTISLILVVIQQSLLSFVMVAVWFMNVPSLTFITELILHIQLILAL